MDKTYKRKLDKWRDKTPYLYILGGFILFIILFFFIFDKLIMPAIVHSRDEAVVPNLVGKTRIESDQILRKLDLYSNIISEQYNTNYEPGEIISQDPKPGSDIKVGRAVQLVVSKGKEEVIVPYVTGISINQARLRFSQRGLGLGDITYEHSESIPRDSIISQSISAGTAVPYGVNISLVVSNGPEQQTLVPNMVGMSFDNIEGFLNENGLQLGTVRYKYSETYTRETIIEQIPGPNRIVDLNTPIDLVVSKESPGMDEYNNNNND